MGARRSDPGQPCGTGVIEVLREVGEGAPRRLDVVSFARQILGIELYPAQETILRVLFLEIEHLTPFDVALIDEWAASWAQGGRVRGILPDVMERMRTLRALGYWHFREALLLVGRRGGKTYLGAIATAFVIYTLIAWEHPQRRLGIDPDKDLVILVAATNRDQSRENAFKDVVTIIRRAKWFRPWIASRSTDELAILTAHDKERMGDTGETAGDAASIRIRAISSSAPSARGPAGVVAWFDEFAHMAMTPSGARSGDELWHAMLPSLDQTKEHGLILITTTPASQTGQAFQTYRQAQEVDSSTGKALYPYVVALQIPSWEPYRGAGDLQATGGRILPVPPETYSELLQKEQQRNPNRFATEREAQWAAVLDAFLDPSNVDRMYLPYCPTCGHSYPAAEWTAAAGACPWCGAPVEAVAPVFHPQGVMRFVYMGHADPAERHDLFTVCVAHLEVFTEPDGLPTHHVVVDHLRAWKPEDHGGELPYLEIQAELAATVARYRFMAGFSYDQFGALATIRGMRKRLRDLGVDVAVTKFSHTAANNKDREEIVKEALAIGLIHCPPDDYGPYGASLLAEEMKRLQLVNGRVMKPTTGDVQTDDLWTAMSVTAYRLLQHQYGAQIREAFSRLPLVAGLPGGYHTNSAEGFSDREPSDVRRRLGAIGRSAGGRGRWGADLHRAQHRFGRGHGDGRQRLG